MRVNQELTIPEPLRPQLAEATATMIAAQRGYEATECEDRRAVVRLGVALVRLANVLPPGEIEPAMGRIEVSGRVLEAAVGFAQVAEQWPDPADDLGLCSLRRIGIAATEALERLSVLHARRLRAAAALVEVVEAVDASTGARRQVAQSLGDEAVSAFCQTMDFRWP